MGDYTSGPNCCDCPTLQLEAVSDWTGVDPGDGVALNSDTNGEYGYTTTRNWLTVTGAVDPVSTLATVDAEAYLIEFRMRGELTVTIDGVDFVIDATTGTLTAGATSTVIPKDADYTNPDTLVQIRTTPTHTYIATKGAVDYGTLFVDRGLGAVLTVDRSTDPTGDFRISGTGDFYGFQVRSTVVKYVDPCGYGGVETLESACSFGPVVPINYRAYKDGLKGDGATYMPLRWGPFDDGLPDKYLWPDITYLGTLPPDGSNLNPDDARERTTITTSQVFRSNGRYEKWKRTTTGITGLTGPFTEYGINHYKYGGTTVPDDIDGVQYVDFPLAGYPGLAGGLGEPWTDALLIRGGVPEPGRLVHQLIEYEQLYEGSGIWNTVFKADKLWPFSTSTVDAGGEELNFVELIMGYKFDVVGTCAEPYPKPQIQIDMTDVVTNPLVTDYFTTSLDVNDVASGASVSSSFWTYQF